MVAKPKAQVHGKWQVLPDLGGIHMKSSRIGFITVNAHAPITGGYADWLPHKADMGLDIGLHSINTGNSLLDSQVRKLVSSGSDGILRFVGAGSATDDELIFEGEAVCGNIIVPMELVGSPGAVALDGSLAIVLGGTATFEDIRIPIPGFGHIKKVDLKIDGDIKLSK